jgi:predicted enzyme related to lactoylglutathione lyase
MERVTGIGGIFFKADNPERLAAWYRKHLGLAQAEGGSSVFEWREKADPERTGMTVWSPFPRDTRYFDPSRTPFMINYRVADLDAMLVQLRAAGVSVDERVEESEYGRFGWVMDPEGNRIELWEPPHAE